jgi:rubrerythrin
MKTETKEIRFHVPVATHAAFKDIAAAGGLTIAASLRAHVMQVASIERTLPNIKDEASNAEALSEFLFTTSQGRGKARAKYWCRACDTHVATDATNDEVCVKCGGYVVK